MNHTPGPFKANQTSEFEFDVIDGMGRTLATVTGWNIEPNANLFAAAPELLAVLKLVEDGMTRGHIKDQPVIRMDLAAKTLPLTSLHELVKHIISKAEGRS